MKIVYVVEQDISRRDLFYDILVQLNCKVTTMSSLANLLESLKKERPDHIIIDVTSTGLDVRDILLQVTNVDKDIKVIALIEKECEAAIKDLPQEYPNAVFLNNSSDPSEVVPSLINILKAKEREVAEESVAFQGSILVVDDDEGAVTLLKRYLTKRGYVVHVSYNGEEAILKVKADNPRIVILDVIMPGMDGLLVLKRIKEIDESVVVIITTGMVDQNVIDEAKRLGASIVFVKPFSLVKLESFILMSALKRGNPL